MNPATVSPSVKFVNAGSSSTSPTARSPAAAAAKAATYMGTDAGDRSCSSAPEARAACRLLEVPTILCCLRPQRALRVPCQHEWHGLRAEQLLHQGPLCVARRQARACIEAPWIRIDD